MRIKVAAIILAAVGTVALICACGKKEEKKNASSPTELTAIQEDSLVNDTYYVKASDGFYAVAHGTKNYKEETTVADPETRVVVFTTDDATIPTLYSDDQLVYYSKNGQVAAFNLERMRDNGYTIGVVFLSPNEGGKYCYKEKESLVVPNTTFSKAMDYLQENGDMDLSTITIDKINGISLTADNMAASGVYKGLSKAEAATTDIYIGTQHAEVSLNADTREFESMEVYNINAYELDPNGYESIILPEYLLSGYYYINGAGLFRYVKGNRADGTSGISFNTPYFYYDEKGNVITYDEYVATADIQEAPKEQEDLDIESADCTNSFFTDKTLKTLHIFVTFTDTETGESDSEGISAKVKDPLGNISDVKTANDGLAFDMEGAPAGEYIIAFYGLDGRVPSIRTESVTGDANSFIHSGNGSGSATLYEEGSDEPHNFNITWENANRAADIVLITPEGSRYDISSTPGSFVVNTYGNVKIHVPWLIRGDYKVIVTGEDLGRVWIEKETITEQEVKEEAESKPNDAASVDMPKDTEELESEIELADEPH